MLYISSGQHFPPYLVTWVGRKKMWWPHLTASLMSRRSSHKTILLRFWLRPSQFSYESIVFLCSRPTSGYLMISLRVCDRRSLISSSLNYLHRGGTWYSIFVVTCAGMWFVIFIRDTLYHSLNDSRKLHCFLMFRWFNFINEKC